jgi:hypothetical protein
MLESLYCKNKFWKSVCCYLGTMIGFLLAGTVEYVQWLRLVYMLVDFEVMAEPHVNVLFKACG